MPVARTFDSSTQSPRSCLAAVFHGAAAGCELQQVDLPASLKVGEALVKVTCCTLCGSDWSTMDGHRQEPTPCILGHEITGVVQQLGPGEILDLRGRPVRLGDRVVWSVIVACQQCDYCVRDLPQKCRYLHKYGHARLAADWRLSGGLAEYCHLLSKTQIVVVDSPVPDRVLAPASCATATAAAALRTAGTISGRRVLVVGAGLLGLTACAMARVHGATHITLCDIVPQRIVPGKQFGADECICTDQLAGDARRLFDVILEMSGSVHALQTALATADIGAQLVLVGAVRPTPPVELYPEQMIRRLWSLHGVHNYRPHDLLAGVEFLEQHGNRFPFAEVIAAGGRLSDLPRTLQTTPAERPIRVAICP